MPSDPVSPAFSEMVDQYAQALQHNPILAAPELICMQDVSVHYGQVPVLQNITWTVRRGERWALLGKNGAGKTTLLSLILADNPQSYANPISLFGRRRGSGESIWEIKRSIGWVSPELHIYFRQSVSLLDVVCSGFSELGWFCPRLFTRSNRHRRALDRSPWPGTISRNAIFKPVRRTAAPGPARGAPWSKTRRC